MLLMVFALTLTSVLGVDNNGNNGKILNMTLCTFEDGLCGWTNDLSEASYAYDWSRITHTSYSISHDHTFGTGSGHFITLDQSTVSSTRVETKLARITSPVFQPSDKYCVQLYYTLSGGSAHPIKVYAKEFGGLGYPLLTFRNYTVTKWKFAQVELDSEYTSTNFQIVIEGATSAFKYYHFGQYQYRSMDQKMGVDDVYVTNTGCGNVPRCPKEAYKYSEGDIVTCWYFNTTADTWANAVKSCRRMSPFGHLVSVETLDKQKALITYINSHSENHIAAQSGVWTSGTDSDVEGYWIWSNIQQRLNYTDWKAGQPNNVGSRQNCLALDYPKQSYSWGDEFCGLEKPFICQMTYDKSIVDAM